jgi:methylphosphotriester-DNA--protein-cysteine methyltransferase
LLKDERAEAIASQVGFKSRKDFNRALEQSTGLTPTQFKQLSDERATDIIETTRLLVLRKRRRP